MQHEPSEMTDEQRERAEALAAANIARTGMSFEEQIVMAEYIFAGWMVEGFDVVEETEVRDGRGHIIFTDTNVTNVNADLGDE